VGLEVEAAPGVEVESDKEQEQEVLEV